MDTTLLGLLALSVLGALCIFFGVRKSGSVEGHKARSTKQDDASEMIEHANDVVAAYGAILEQTSHSAPGIAFHSESQLPYPKSEIRKSIELLLLVALDEEDRVHLRASDMFLNDFISDEEYQAIQEQQVGFSKALERGAAGDVKTMSALLVNSGTSASKLLTRQIQERIIQEGKTTLDRHQVLKLAAAKLATSRS